jgi:hypothetical protein
MGVTWSELHVRSDSRSKRASACVAPRLDSIAETPSAVGQRHTAYPKMTCRMAATRKAVCKHTNAQPTIKGDVKKKREKLVSKIKTRQ